MMEGTRRSRRGGRQTRTRAASRRAADPRKRGAPSLSAQVGAFKGLAGAPLRYGVARALLRACCFQCQSHLENTFTNIWAP